MAINLRRFASILLAALVLGLALPASAEQWTYWRAGDLKRGAEIFTTQQDTTHTVAVSICAPGDAFVCARLPTLAALAVPKGKLPDRWEFEGFRYQVIDRNAGLVLLGEHAEGVFIRSSTADGEPFEFLYSAVRGFTAFKWMETPRKAKSAFISTGKCAMGAASSCREK